jgi:ribose transport system permease protein
VPSDVPETTAIQPKSVRSFLAQVSGALAPLSFLVALCAFLSVYARQEGFASSRNITEIAVQSAVVAILACGQTAVIISGNIDLSVGAVMALSGVVAGLAMTQHGCGVWEGVTLACLTGLIVGSVSGAVTAYGRIPAFIVTLGMMGIAHGIAGIASHSVTIGGIPNAFRALAQGQLFGSATREGAPYAALIMAAAALAVHVALKRTHWGRTIYAIGGNMEAARLSGVPVRWIIVTVFALSGLLAGLAGTVNTARYGVAWADAGIGKELDAVAATVVGGTSLFGGQGGIFGTIIGAILIYTIRNGCDLKGYEQTYQEVIIGAVVILAVLYDQFGPGRRRSA